MKKTILSLLLVCLLLLPQAVFADEHTHTPSAEWDMDAAEHWHACSECGERLDAQPHSMDDVVCTVCDATVWVYDDGSGNIECVDEYFNNTRFAYFDADGIITDDYRFVNEYDENGFILQSLTYYNGMLCEENFYTFNEDGDYIPVKQNYYNDDGSSSYAEYNEFGDIVKSVSYDAEGNIEFEETTEYTYDENGLLLESRLSGSFSDGSSYMYVYNGYGDETACIFYDAEGNPEITFRSEYEYSEGGIMLSEKRYIDEVLMSENIYTETQDEFGFWYSYLQTGTDYYEDGTYTICEYDQDGYSVKDLEYDANGSLLSETAYVTDKETYSQTATTTYADGTVCISVYSEYGFLTSETRYAADGSLTEETLFTYDEDSFSSTGVTTYADGTSKTSEYDEFGALLKETYYAADGTVTDEIVYSLAAEDSAE